MKYRIKRSKKLTLLDLTLIGIFDIAFISMFAKPSVVSIFCDLQRAISYNTVRNVGLHPYDVSMALLIGLLIILVPKKSSYAELFAFIIIIPCVLMLNNMESWYLEKMLEDPTLKSLCYLWLKNLDMLCITICFILSISMKFLKKPDLDPFNYRANIIIIATGIVVVFVFPEILYFL